MKKITVPLGASYNEFERQLKDTINNMVDMMEKISSTKTISHDEMIESSVCDLCQGKTTFTVINNIEKTYKFYCDTCLNSASYL
jgi:hypothetical protein